MKVRRIASIITSIILVMAMLGTAIPDSQLYAFADDDLKHIVVDQDSSMVEYSTLLTGGNTSLQNSTTTPVFLNGNIFAVSGTKVVKINPDTGKIINSSSETVNNAYTYFLGNSDNMLFVQCGTKVKAFDEELNCKWTSSGVEGEQGLSRILYSNGYVYAATVSNAKGTTPANMFCINANTGAIVWQYTFESDGVGGEYGAWRGSYWGGIVDTGDYVVFFGEGGYAYSFKTGAEGGELIERLDLGANYSCRSGAVYSEGKIYFTANDYAASGYPGNLFSVEFDKTNGTFGSLESTALGNCSVATPAIYGDRIYAATNGTIVVLDKNMNVIYKIVAGKTKIYSVVLTSIDNQIYGYATYYDVPGGIIAFKDKEGQTKADSFDLGSKITSSSAQYCASQALIGPDGGVYFTNDSGNLIKIMGHKLQHVQEAAGYLKHGYQYDVCSVCNKQFNYTKIEGYGSTGVKSFKVSKGSKSFTAKWSKLSKSNQKKTSGYQVRYSTKSSMENAKYTTASKTSKSKTVKRLAKKKTYYVQARTFVNYNGEKFYSKWTSVKKVKTK